MGSSGTERKGVKPAARLTALAVAAVAIVMLLAVTPAWAEIWKIDPNAPVSMDKCNYCHATLLKQNQPGNKASEIIFSHGYHMAAAPDCRSCHDKFPHGKSGTVKPMMKDCWNCHNLRHGPIGLVASGKCEDCHMTPRDQLRPAFHTKDWAQKPHVAPSIKPQDMQAKCMMCHEGKFCDDCHIKENITWQPKVPYAYDAKGGCLKGCHDNENLLKTVADQAKSYQVTGVQRSVHDKLACQQCHPDFKYDDKPNNTFDWSVNAGLGCQNCKDHSKQKAVFLDSVHGQKLVAGNLDTANCGSCHGGHYIQKLDNKVSNALLHADAERVCASSGCHRKYYDSYNDYYHGAAYKQGQGDAPACWECHGAHNAYPKFDAKSTVSAKNTPKTCGGEQAGRVCHKGSDENFVRLNGTLIHEKDKIRSNNPLLKAVNTVKGWMPGN